MYFYSKTKQIHNISNLFYFGTALYLNGERPTETCTQFLRL